MFENIYIKFWKCECETMQTLGTLLDANRLDPKRQRLVKRKVVSMI